jgi:hypothetical protein
MEKIKYLKNIQVIKEQTEPGILAIKATGVTQLKDLISPVLVAAERNKQPAGDGVFELDFVLGQTGTNPVDVEMEIDVVFKLKNVPDWVRAIKVNALENSDIELI